MLSPRHVLAALEAKRAAFEGYELRIGQTLERYRQALTWFAQQDHASLLARLAGSPTPGARPTKERAVGQPFIRPFGLGWENHAQARAWAMEILHGVTTAAVDGSQITPSA
ncbi:MAG: NurA domain-containing protein, partial [Chloroflexi bacterium]|nr:NurA domain-containing protein [Chloroflexota bacterium]